MRLSGKFAFVVSAAALAWMGRDKFYMRLQDKGRLPDMYRWFAGHGDLQRITRNWAHVMEEGQSPRLSSAAVQQYSSHEDLGGWVVEKQTWGDMHNPLEDQIRGQMFPMLDKAIAEGAKVAVEIGSSNGDVLAHFAAKYPDVSFVGIDFQVPQHHAPRNNLTFRKGYALDMLEAGEVTGDIVFAESTLTVVGPRELENYAAAIAKAGFKTVLVLDPLTRGYSPDKYPNESRHMTFGMWGHDYGYYFGKVGYKTTASERPLYTKQINATGKQTTFQLLRFDRA